MCVRYPLCLAFVSFLQTIMLWAGLHCYFYFYALSIFMLHLNTNRLWIWRQNAYWRWPQSKTSWLYFFFLFLGEYKIVQVTCYFYWYRLQIQYCYSSPPRSVRDMNEGHTIHRVIISYHSLTNTWLGCIDGKLDAMSWWPHTVNYGMRQATPKVTPR